MAAMARELEVIIYGLACFDELPRGGGYRVLFPDGRVPSPHAIPPHTAMVWVRDRSETAVARWPWSAGNNDYTVAEPRKLTISGLKRTDLNANGLTDEILSLRKADPAYALDTAPEAIIDLTIDQGTLTAHQFPTGMIVVRWLLHAEDGQPVRFNFGDDAWIETSPATKQVVLANAGKPEAQRMIGPSHFTLYRKLSTVKTGDLVPPIPVRMPMSLGVTLIDPSHGYARPRTPDLDCSPASTRPRP
jgi:hypothetical protein